MEQYIKKSTLVAEIERILLIHTKRYKELAKHEVWTTAKEIEHRIQGLKEALSIINNLEVKGVDLEKEINTYISNNFFGSETLGFFANRTKGEPDDQDIALCAKHFFELGIKKGQKNVWHSMDETPNYPCEILFLTDVDNIFLYRYMENGKPVDIETPYFRNILRGKCWCYCHDVKAQKGEQ